MINEAYMRGNALDVGQEHVLLLDDTYVEDRWNVQRIVVPPNKEICNPVMVADQPWEEFVNGARVLYDDSEDIYHMWYVIFNRAAFEHQFVLRDWNKVEHGMPYFVGYARSPDGVNWEKPLFDDKPYMRYAKSNVVMTGVQKASAPQVIWNPQESTGCPERFLMMYKDNLPNAKGCLCLAFSDDGIHWRVDDHNPVVRRVRDTFHNMVYDPVRKRWILITRPLVTAGKPDMADHPEHNFKRRVAVALGDTPYSFNTPRTVLWPDECDAWDLDNMIGSRLGQHFIGTLTHMGPMPLQEIEVHLCSSSDGIVWQQLPQRTPFLSRGGPGSFDAGLVSCVVPVQSPERMLYYYTGQNRGQGSKNRIGGIGVAYSGTNRLVAQTGQPEGGFLLSREIIVAGPHLELNLAPVDPYTLDSPALKHCDYEIKVELLACQDGAHVPTPIPGFTMESCLAQPVNLTSYRLEWEESPDLSAWIGKPIHIRFFLRNVGIYSFRFCT